MSDRALKKATELVAQFLNRMPGPERSAPDEREIRMATDHLLRGAPYAAVEVLQQPIRIASLNRWKESEGVFWEWIVATGNHCTPFSTSTTVKHRMTYEEAASITAFLCLNAEAILFPIENEDMAVKRVRRVRRLPKEDECRVHADEGMAVDEDGWPLTGDDREPNEDEPNEDEPNEDERALWLSEQFTHEYGYGGLHDEEGGPGFQMRT